MKKAVLASIVVAVLCGAPAFAADAMVSWTGVYAGVHGGYAWNKLSASEVNTLTVDGPTTIPFVQTETVNPNGVIYGARIGADYEFPNHVVIGIAGEIPRGRAAKKDTLAIGGENPSVQPIEVEVRTSFNVRGRVGYAFDNLMVFATGGYVQGKGKIDLITGEGVLPSGNVTHKGWLGGAGVEMRLLQNWRLGLEYRYLSLGKEDYCFPLVLACIPTKWNTHHTLVSVNYQF